MGEIAREGKITHRNKQERKKGRKKERNKEKKSISNYDTMRVHRNYITTHRQMRRLVRVFTATVMLNG